MDINIKSPDKIYFPETGVTKGDIIEYYVKIAPYILPHLAGRPFCMIHFPEGKTENMFYRKERPADAPDCVGSVKIPSARRGFINWCTVDNVESLIYMANRSVIEAHAWFSRADSLQCPDMAVIDLDPGAAGFKGAVAVAEVFRGILDGLGIKSVPKTSGSRGIHVCVPLAGGQSYADVKRFLSAACGAAESARPDLCTRERTVAKRGGRVYLDAVQCAYGKTIAMPYSVRARGRGAVSCPFKWEEINVLDPSRLNVKTVFDRIAEYGDLFEGFYARGQRLFY